MFAGRDTIIPTFRRSCAVGRARYSSIYFVRNNSTADVRTKTNRAPSMSMSAVFFENSASANYADTTSTCTQHQ